MEKQLRKIILLNDGWAFTKEGETVMVNIPHNWNSKDGQDGGNDYYRGKCTYVKEVEIPAMKKDQKAYLEFQGVNSSCDVMVGDKVLTHHDGGYSTFRVEVTKDLIVDNKIKLTVVVDNIQDYRVYPQRADFTFYGGIYRDVNLIIVNENHFDLMHYGGLGADIDVYMEGKTGKVDVTSYIKGEGQAKVTLLDEGKVVAETMEGKIEVENPHLWDGLKDPHLYTLRLELIKDGEIVDGFEKNVGFRSFHVDPKKGFFLNGRSYPLRGVARHQDRKDIGNSLTHEHQDEDIELIKEIGANTIRLAHYQHNDYFLDACDKAGFVVWAEIPYISCHADEGNANTEEQMKELIIQQKHHASICHWGTSNEITMFKGHQKELVAQNKVLHELCHKMDKHRETTMACFAMCGQDNPVTKITDVVSWNLYFGWYTPFLWLNEVWFDAFHLFHPKRPVGLSEYGAEGMTHLHSNHPHRGDSTEEYQLIYHNHVVKFIDKRPWLWATHVWNMFDFGSDGRDHGGDPGVNHKGLMTFDHKLRKDSFYICKAYWNAEPMVHIAGKRFENRNGGSTKVVVITNEPKVELTLNGKKFKTLKGKKYYTVKVPLKGDIEVVAKTANCEDKACFKKVAKYDENYRLHTHSNNYSWEK